MRLAGADRSGWPGPGRCGRIPGGGFPRPALNTSTPLKDASSKASYAVVVQANAYDHLSTWLVAPTTTKSFGSMIHPAIELLGQDIRVLVEQTTAVDPQRLGDFAGRLDPEKLMEINVALRVVLDIGAAN